MGLRPNSHTVNDVSRRVGQEGGVKKGGTLKTFGGFLREDFEDGVILAVMNYLMRVK